MQDKEPRKRQDKKGFCLIQIPDSRIPVFRISRGPASAVHCVFFYVFRNQAPVKSEKEYYIDGKREECAR